MFREYIKYIYKGKKAFPIVPAGGGGIDGRQVGELGVKLRAVSNRKQ
jgi:hypothetical protein